MHIVCRRQSVLVVKPLCQDISFREDTTNGELFQVIIWKIQRVTIYNLRFVSRVR